MAERAALAQEVAVQMLETTQPQPQAIVRGKLLDGDALLAHAVDEPLSQRGIGLQQLTKSTGHTSRMFARGVHDSRAALVGGGPYVRHKASPAEHPAVFVCRQTPLQQTIDLPAMDARLRLDLGQGSAGHVELDGRSPVLENPLQWTGEGADVERWPRVGLQLEIVAPAHDAGSSIG